VSSAKTKRLLYAILYFHADLQRYNKTVKAKTGQETAKGTEPVDSTHTIENRLRASEERYQAFIHNSNEGIWRVEVEKPISIRLSPTRQIELMYKYAYLAEANEAMARMYGLKAVEDIVGARLGDLLIQDDPKNIEYLKAFIANGYNLSGAESHEHDTKGNDKYFRNSLVGMVRDDHLVHAWGTQQNITEQRVALRALHASQERLELSLAASQTGMWEWDIANDKLTWTNELKRIFGLKAKDVVTYALYKQIVHPDDRQRVQSFIDKSLSDGSSYSFEHRVLWPNGTEHWVMGQGRAYLENGRAVRMVGTSMLIDKRKRYEIALHESEQRFRMMADTAPVLIWMAGPDKQRTYFNKPWLDFTGHTLPEELGSGWTKGIHPDDYERNLKTYNQAFDERASYSLEYRLHHHDGTYHWMLANGTPRYSPEGEFLGFIGSMTDIQEVKNTKKSKEELEEVNQKLREQQYQLVTLNNSKDEFISLASHQLRTPATGVKQYIGMLLEGYGGPLSKPQMKMLHTAYESNERQLNIIDDLLKVAHIDAGKVALRKQKVDLVDMIDDIIDEQADKFKQKKQGVSFRHVRKKVPASIDPERMRMVLENLIDNAGKYSPEGKKIMVQLKKNKDHVTISVTDEGVGIAQKDIPRLFQKFSRVSNSLSTLVGGTGLGLYWAEKIVSLHHGSIDVTSRLHKGSTFTIKIPQGKHTGDGN